MSQNYNAIKLNKNDNTAVALTNLKEGDGLFIQGEQEQMIVKENISYGHKIATTYIPHSGKVLKYGECFGIATKEIQPGFHVHVMNVRGLNEEERSEILKESSLS